MGLIKETNAQYYAGEQVQAGNGTITNTIIWPSSMTPLVWDNTATNVTSVDNFKVYVDNVEQVKANLPANGYSLSSVISNGTSTQTVVLTSAANIPSTSVISVRLIQQSIWDNYGSYSYTSLKDVVNNFMVAYVGMDKIIPRVKRSDVIFHAKRGLQEFSYDTLKSVNSQELTIPPSLSLIIPQDYVNYVQLSWVDASGVKHIIYPTTLTSNPTQPLVQDSAGQPTQDIFGNNVESMQSITDARWANNNNLNITGQITNQVFQNADVYDFDWWKMTYGQRYGLEPEVSQKNGWFTINEREGKFSFSSGLVGKLIILEYISDGLAYDMDSKIPKMAEEALYMHIAYSILASKSNIQEYIVQRFKRDRRAQLRNAKIRLSNIKLEEFTQVMRGKSKWIKH
tara:strand:+ start:1123 stop:2316 length:1194 start_codon:yes stop_codon:yes gene_type:complete